MPEISHHTKERTIPPILRIVLLFVLLYGFLVAIQLMGGTFKTLGKEGAKQLMTGIHSPLAGLSIGILATVIVQSSSMTTSLVVSVVGLGAGQLSPELAVYTIMGCNMGTTVTNTLVSLGHVRQPAEFRRAFAGATMHDFFNLMAIVIFLPLQYFTHCLSDLAGWAAELAYGGGGGKFHSPIKSAVKYVSKPVKEFFLDTLGLGHPVGGTILIVLSLAILFLCLILITKNMRALIQERLERSLNAVLGKSGILAIAIGVILTVAVQSSSITTSLMIPLFAAGILRLENGFPVTLGANIGTTITAILASMATDQIGLQIALVHLFFNLGATSLIYPIPFLRRIPLDLARKLAGVAVRSKLYAAAYVVLVFILIPLLGAFPTN